MKLDLSIEPTFITLGPFHIAVSANDKVWIHEIGELEAGILEIMYFIYRMTNDLVLLSGVFLERSYTGNLNAIQLNGYYAAALFDGKIELHLVCTFLFGYHICSNRSPGFLTLTSR